MAKYRLLAPHFALLALLAACNGQIIGGGSGPTGAAGGGTGAPGGNGQGPDGVGPWPTHLLTNDEYNNTVADLLGTTSKPADFFPAVSATDFDANVGVLESISDVQGEAFFDAAKQLADEVFASPDLTSKVLICSPTSDTDLVCPQQIITAFARRAWRRPVDDEETQALVAVYSSARSTLGMSHPDAIAHVVRVVLSSPSMFMRVERVPSDPKQTLEPAALASRLSYLIWGSQPDEALLQAAENGGLNDNAAVLAQADRLLADPKGSRFIDRFLGQWLGLGRLSTHPVDTTLFPEWNTDVAAGALAQADQYVAGFVTGGQKWSDFLHGAHPTNAAIAPLLAHDPSGVRQGFLTLPAFLTFTSHSDRTSPTSRAKTIIAAMMCTNLSPPPGVNTTLEASDGGTANPQTVREQLEAHRAAPSCASCHDVLDPIGLSLENFDAVGSWRTLDNGLPIDASGTYQGTSFTDLRGLLPMLEQDKRLNDCAPRKLFAFALRRSLTVDDETAIQTLATDWSKGPLDALVHGVVVRPAFKGSLTDGDKESNP